MAERSSAGVGSLGTLEEAGSGLNCAWDSYCLLPIGEFSLIFFVFLLLLLAIIVRLEVMFSLQLVLNLR